MASIRERNGKFNVIYSYTNEKGERKQKWEIYETKAEAKRRKKNSGGSSWMAENIASLRRVLTTGSITWSSKKQDVDQADFVCNRHPKFLSGFEI